MWIPFFDRSKSVGTVFSNAMLKWDSKHKKSLSKTRQVKTQRLSLICNICHELKYRAQHRRPSDAQSTLLHSHQLEKSKFWCFLLLYIIKSMWDVRLVGNIPMFRLYIRLEHVRWNGCTRAFTKWKTVETWNLILSSPITWFR